MLYRSRKAVEHVKICDSPLNLGFTVKNVVRTPFKFRQSVESMSIDPCTSSISVYPSVLNITSGAAVHRGPRPN